MLEREHIAVYEVQVATLFGGDPVEVFELTDIVGAHPAVLSADGVALHATLVVAAQKAIDIELGKVRFLLFGGQEGSGDALLPADYPRVEGVLDELQALLLDIRKARLFEVSDHMGRNSKNSSNFVDLEFSGFKELRLFWGNADGRIFHALFQNGDLPGVAAAAELALPCIAHPAGILHGAGVFKNAAGGSSICKQLGTIFLGGDGKADGVLGHGDGAVTNEAVEAKAGDVQDICRLQDYGRALHRGGFLIGSLVLVEQFSVAVPVHGHLVRHERVQGHDLTLAVADNLCVSIAPQEQVCHEGLSEHEAAHFRVWFVV